jgi:cytochrome c oxidase subunit III
MTAAALPRRPSMPTAWWGMLILIASEAMLFGCLIATYYYFRFRTPNWPPAGIDPPPLATTLILTFCLAATSVPMQLAALAARAGNLVRARLFLVAALVVQCGYLAFEIDEFRAELAKTAISRDAYSSIYYTLVGADHAHVALGILFTVWLLGKLTTGLTRYRVNASLAIAWYWHFVNVLTIVVAGTVLSAHA